MTFQNYIARSGRTLLFALVISCTLASVSFAQDMLPEDQGKMYGDAGFTGEPISLSVVNADIRDILSYITELYGINFVIDKSVGDVPVTIKVNEVPWNVTLDAILRSQELGAQPNGPILRIATAKNLAEQGEIEQKKLENQLDSSPLYTEMIRLNYARASNKLSGESGSSGGYSGGSGGSSAGGSADQGILAIIQKRLSRRGSVEVDGRTNTLIITDVKDNIAALRKLVYRLDQPAPQVEVEARIVVASRTFSRDLGFQLSAIIADTTRGAGGILSTLPGDSNNTINSGNANGNNPGTGFDFTQPNGNLGGVANTIIGLTTGVFGTAKINMLITAGEQKGNVKTVATPRITVLNNRSGEIESGQQIPVTTVQPGSGSAVVATTEYVPVPVRLAVTPQITDAGSVILQIVAENNSIPANTGGTTPAISVQRMKTEVIIPDGGTTIVGGALFDSESEIRDRTPGLASIPIIGNLFKRKQVSRNTNELIFFITPRIYRSDYNGRPISGPVLTKPTSTTMLQPVPLGNPGSNSAPSGNEKPTVNVAPVQIEQQVAPAATPQPKVGN